MAQLSLSIAGRDYPLACADGDEARLLDLAAFVNKRAESLKEKLGHISESRLLVMTALVIADELKDLSENNGLPDITAGLYSDEDLASIIDQVAFDIEGIAERLKQA